MDFKAKAVIKQQLLGDPFTVDSRDLDPESVDTSPAHRQEMRKKLYGIRRKKFHRKSCIDI